ncbi:MAG: hypothetical protein R2734_03810 [Nocardioides sp.]
MPTFALLEDPGHGRLAGHGQPGPLRTTGLATLLALAAFALPPIITNAYVAIREWVPDDVREAAWGMWA